MTDINRLNENMQQLGNELAKGLRHHHPVAHIRITVEGGVVQAVESDQPVLVTLIDFDEGDDAAPITEEIPATAWQEEENDAEAED